jgi:hypothetical protein
MKAAARPAWRPGGRPGRGRAWRAGRPPTGPERASQGCAAERGGMRGARRADAAWHRGRSGGGGTTGRGRAGADAGTGRRARRGGTRVTTPDRGGPTPRGIEGEAGGARGDGARAGQGRRRNGPADAQPEGGRPFSPP